MPEDTNCAPDPNLPLTPGAVIKHKDLDYRIVNVYTKGGLSGRWRLDTGAKRVANVIVHLVAVVRDVRYGSKWVRVKATATNLKTVYLLLRGDKIEDDEVAV